MTSTNIPCEKYDYVPVQSYWFYSKKTSNNIIWLPFSLNDIEKLEQAYIQNQDIISTNGSLYDVNITQRIRIPIYWNDESNEIRRSKWFYSIQKTNSFIPFDESMDEILENLYIETCNEQSWHKTYEINNGKEIIIFHNPNQMIMQYNNNQTNNENKSSYEIRILKRGLPDIFLNEIKSGDNDSVEHLCFVVHGIGSACDIKFRSLIECVEDFRQTSRMILQTHLKSYEENNHKHRIEFLPISWHADLHLDSTGVDNHLSPLTLPSITKFRTFINTTLADILFYTSPIYCQRIITRCINEMNRLYDLFLQRNPLFKGQISVIGHSLGSVILYDILSNQTFDIEYNISNKINNSTMNYEKLKFPIENFFALGSPIALFLTVRGITSIPLDFILPTCKSLFNIFHPCDPIAYRLEPLIDSQWTLPPVLLSHHKGRKRMHLELIDKFSKVNDMKEKMFGIFKNTKTFITDFMTSYSNPLTSLTNMTIEQEDRNENDEIHITDSNNRPIGKLNQGRRIDYVLQHRPIEIINEYLFAFTSHVSYWCSEDTMLLILNEILKLDNF